MFDCGIIIICAVVIWSDVLGGVSFAFCFCMLQLHAKNTANDCSCALVIRGSTNLVILCECHGNRWDVIASCWSASAEERPNFATLVKTLTDLLDSDPTYIKL